MVDRLKVGGITYNVSFTENISLGTDYTGEIDYRGAAIRIRPNDSGRMMQIMIHEILHAVDEFHGIAEKDEVATERMAQALAMIAVDNPKIFDIESYNMDT